MVLDLVVEVCATLGVLAVAFEDLEGDLSLWRQQRRGGVGVGGGVLLGSWFHWFAAGQIWWSRRNMNVSWGRVLLIRGARGGEGRTYGS